MALTEMPEPTRIDKWLWAARFFRTRSLAAEAVERGQVRLGSQRIKPARSVRVGDCLVLQRGAERIEFVVRGLSGTRGPASVAQQLYVETPESRMRREQAAIQQRLMREPAATRKGRPSKREARALQRLTGRSENESS